MVAQIGDFLRSSHFIAAQGSDVVFLHAETPFHVVKLERHLGEFGTHLCAKLSNITAHDMQMFRRQRGCGIGHVLDSFPAIAEKIVTRWQRSLAAAVSSI